MTPENNNQDDRTREEGQGAYGRAKDLFIRLVDLPSDQRELGLREACGGDPAIEEQVRRLLAFHDGASEEGQSTRKSGPTLPPSLGPYVPTRLLGEGGTGAVYLAYHQEDQAPVALKVLHPGILARESHIRFNRESDVLDKLNHPGIASLLATGEEPTPHGPVYYLVTEYIDGPRLDQYLAGTALAVAQKLALFLKICEAVAHAHEAGVVHRDLKPPNILVTADDRPHILDFGVSRILDTASTEMTAVTETGQLIGTLKYMSPEQVKGTEVGPQTDVYALGLILHEILTGKPPYEVPSTSIHQSLAAVLTATPTWPSDHDPELDPTLDAIVAKCLAREPGDRYADAAALATDLKAQRSGDPVSAPAPERPSRPPTRSKRRWFMAAAILLVTIGWLSWQEWGKPRESTEQGLWPVLALLDAVDQELHFKQHSRAGLTQAVALLDSAQTILQRSPGSPARTALQRYSYSRLGEAHFFLGSLADDPAEYLLALRSFDSANQPLFDPAELAGLPEDSPVTPRARRRGRHHPSLGQGLVCAALADHQRPRYNLEQAVFFCEEARKLQQDLRGPNYWQAFSEGLRQEDRAIILNDLARNLTLMAEVCDSLPLVNRALPLFAEADTSTALRDNISAYASLLRGRAEAFLVRAEISRSAADLDSARLFLDHVRGLGESSQAARIRNDLMMGEAALLMAEWEEPGPAMGVSLDEATAWVTKARQVLEDSKGNLASDHEVELLGLEARIELARAVAGDDPARLDQADYLLANALTALPPERFAFLRSQLLLLRSETAWSRFTLTAREQDLGLAREYLAEGLPYADPAFHPRLARQYREAGAKYQSTGN